MKNCLLTNKTCSRESALAACVKTLNPAPWLFVLRSTAITNESTLSMSKHQLTNQLHHAILALVKKTIELLHEDPSLLVADKPSGWLSINDRYDPDAPVILSALEKTYGKLFVVHRIDKDTSGVLLFARNADAHRILSEQFYTHEVQKKYIALVRGIPDTEEWTCDLPLRVDADKLHRTIIDARRGKDAFTRFKLLESLGNYAMVEAYPETGRTHQIRVHLAATGYPIACDPLYGDGKPILLSSLKRRWKGDLYEEKPLIARTALHAEYLSFIHPVSNERFEVSSPLPRDMKAVFNQLRLL